MGCQGTDSETVGSAGNMLTRLGSCYLLKKDFVLWGIFKRIFIAFVLLYLRSFNLVISSGNVSDANTVKWIDVTKKN